MVSLARAKTPFPARAVEPSKRAAIIDVPSLAPPRFSFPFPILQANQGQSSSPRLGRVPEESGRDFSAARKSDFLPLTAECLGGRKNAISRFRHAARVTAEARARERVSKNAV